MCKFYQGAEDRLLEKSLKAMFAKVHREKPESSRSVRFSPIPPHPSPPGSWGPKCEARVGELTCIF